MSVQKENESQSPISVWVGNLARYTEGRLEGEWLELPMQPDDLQSVIGRISRDGADELIIMDTDLREDCFYMSDIIGEWSSLSQLNTVAELIGNTPHPAVEAYVVSDNVTSLSEIANVLLQEEKIPYHPYQFEGSDNSELMERLSDEEKMGYTVIESNPEMKHLLETTSLGTGTLGSYIDVEAVGRDLFFSGKVGLFSGGYINLKGDMPDLELYQIEDIEEALFQNRDKQEEKTVETSHVQKPKVPSI